MIRNWYYFITFLSIVLCALSSQIVGFHSASTHRFFPSFQKEKSLVNNISKAVLCKDLERIKTMILSLLIGEDDLAYTIYLQPQTSFNVSKENITKSLKADPEETDSILPAQQITTSLVEYWLGELIINKDNLFVNYWSEEEKSVSSYRMFKNYSHHRLEDVILKNPHQSSFNSPTSDTVSTIRYKESFAVYNFNTRKLRLINNKLLKMSFYTVQDFELCYTSKNKKWLWDLSGAADRGHYCIKRYDLETHSLTKTKASWDDRSFLMQLLKYECATSHDGSTCVSYFPKKSHDTEYKEYLVVWNGIKPLIKKVVKLEKATPHNAKISPNGRYLIYEERSTGDLIQLHALDLYAPQPQKARYTFEFPLQWSMSENGENIIAVHGTKAIDFINPHLNIRYTIDLTNSYQKSPVFSLSPHAESLVWISYTEKTRQEQRASSEEADLVPNVKFVMLNKQSLKAYELKHIAFAYSLFRALTIAQYGKGETVHLLKGEPAHTDFVTLPNQLAQFFLTTYPGQLRVQGQHSATSQTTKAWDGLFV